VIAQPSIPVLNGLGAIGIGIAVFAGFGVIAFGVASFFAYDDRKPVKYRAIGGLVCIPLMVLGLGLGVWAISSASLRTDQNIPNRLDRKQVDVNEDLWMSVIEATGQPVNFETA